MNSDQVINRLLREGTITRVSVNRYRINRTSRANLFSHVISYISLYTKNGILTIFAIHCSDGRYIMRTSNTNESNAFRETVSNPAPVIPEPVRLRTISRSGYHSQSRNLEAALARLNADSDGVRRSFGLEYEIYSLTPEQEDKLARLLDTLPPHITERDGSLSSTGVEIVFEPMSAENYIDTFNKLKRFVSDNEVNMNGTGAHTTYGVNNANVTISDLQIRLNRISLSVKATSSQRSIMNLFGRDYTGYAKLPSSLTEQCHSNAWSASRGDSAYELRLINYKADAVKIVEFMKATEFIFTRPFNAQDFITIFRLMGSDCSIA